MFKAYGRYWKSYFAFSGKTNLRDYWLAVLAYFFFTFIWMFAGGLAIGLIGRFTDITQELSAYIGYLPIIYIILNLIPMLSMAVRRLNDAGYDWKILLWGLVPVIGQIITLVYLCKDTGAGLAEKCAKEGHRWTYDRTRCVETCAVCAATRSKHNYKKIPDRCAEKCTICGKEIDRPHQNQETDDPDFVRCKICGQYAATLRNFTREEKEALKFAIDIGVKANQNRSLDESYASCRRQVNSRKPELGFVEMTVLVLTAHQVNQAIVQNLRTQLNGSNLNMGMVNNLSIASNLKTAIDKFAAMAEKLKNRTASGNAQVKENASATKKPLASFASYDESYQGYKKGGVCDVCNKTLEGKKAYAVPNDVFYASPEYREHMKSGPFSAVMGHKMTDADIDRMRDQDKSPGSAVCEDCIHMFADSSAAPNGSSDTKYYERDNLGTRQDSFGQANVYWMAERVRLKVKPPFTLFAMPSKKAAEKALLELPFMHRAADTGKLICDRMMTFGVYEIEKNGAPTGEFEAMITGSDLTLAEFNLAEEALERHGGKRKNSAAPDASVQAEKIVLGDAAKVAYDTTTVSADGKNTYECYKAPDKACALAFLKTKTVTKPLYYIAVDTPEGSFGRDVNGCYRVADESEMNQSTVTFL